jgi:hypothetical protein
LLLAESGSIRCLGISQHSKESKGPFVRKATSLGNDKPARGSTLGASGLLETTTSAERLQRLE